MKFVGIDLGWGELSQSGAAVIDSDGTLVKVCASLKTNDAICEFAGLGGTEGAVVAIDAPLIVRNAGQCRPVEQQLTQIFWPYDAAPFPANLANPVFQEGGRIRRLITSLEEKGFVHRGAALRQQEQRTLIEVFPSPAQVILFPGRNRRGHIHCSALRYKHKQGRSWAEVHSQWEIYRARLRSLQYGNPALKFTPEVNEEIAVDITRQMGNRYKRYDDLLDGIFCAYLAYYLWHVGSEGSWIVGDLETGCVTLPKCPLQNCMLNQNALSA